MARGPADELIAVQRITAQRSGWSTYTAGLALSCPTFVVIGPSAAMWTLKAERALAEPSWLGGSEAPFVQLRPEMTTSPAHCPTQRFGA
jgi:hypothetical protein